MIVGGGFVFDVGRWSIVLEHADLVMGVTMITVPGLLLKW